MDEVVYTLDMCSVFHFHTPKALSCAILGLVVLSGCAEFEALQAEFAPKPARPATAPAQAEIPVSSETTAADLDAATAREKSAAKQVSGGRVLGQTIASLGTPAESGFWLKTPLVDEEQKGAVRSVSTGQRVAVTLIPIKGPPTAGSRISLSAMRLLNIPLTDLAELEVTLGG